MIVFSCYRVHRRGCAAWSFAACAATFPGGQIVQRLGSGELARQEPCLPPTVKHFALARTFFGAEPFMPRRNVRSTDARHEELATTGHWSLPPIVSLVRHHSPGGLSKALRASQTTVDQTIGLSPFSGHGGPDIRPNRVHG